MSETLATSPTPLDDAPIHEQSCLVAVIWIDWYAYHLARFRGLLSTPELAGRVAGIELVGGVGVHPGLVFREERAGDLPVETLFPGADWAGTSKLRIASQLWRRLSRISPAVVLVPGYYTLPGLAAALWAWAHGRVSVLMTESTAADHRRTGWKEAVKARVVRNLFDWAITGGRAHVRYLQQLGFPQDRIAGCYDVVANGWFREGVRNARQQVHEAAGLPGHYVLYAGRLAPEKNVAGLLSSWLKYRQDGGTWSLVLVGDGPERAALEALAAASRFGVDVHFAGHRSSAAMLPFYAFAECFVLPSLREPWGLVVNEAMASGLPVIVSSRCGCAEDLVEPGENGFVFNPHTDGELAFFLSRMEALGEGRRRRMGNRSSARIADFSPERFGREIARIAAHGRLAS